MAKLGINTGTSPNTGTGDSLIVAGNKINNNFTEIYGYFGDGNNLTVKNYWVETASGIHTSTNVGIGTTNPTEKLQVLGNFIVTGLTTTQNLQVTGVSTLSTLGVTGLTTTQNLQVTGVSTLSTLNVGVGGSIITTTVAGNVGIGTINPTAILHIGPGAAAANMSPLKLSVGTNLSIPEEGSIEYDGTTYYATPNINYGRSTIPTTIYTSGIGSTSITGSVNNPIFPTSQDTITLPVGTYFATTAFRINVAGSVVASACTFNMRGDGTAVGSFSWRGTGAILDSGAASSFVIAATSLVAGPTFTVTASSSANPRQYIVIGAGILRITTAGTIIPSYSFGATLTSGTTTLAADNYLIIQSLDTSASSVKTGGWS